MTDSDHRLKISTGDNFLDMFACALAEAFSEAASGDWQSRADLLEIFTTERMSDLYSQGKIAWDPAAVPTQLMLEV